LPETVLTVERLTVYRETYAAVQDVSFSLEAGTDMAIVGPNGAGKSTLIQAILGILPSQSGQVCFLGQPLLPAKPSTSYPTLDQTRYPAKRHLLRQIAYLPQNFLFDRRMPMIAAELVGLGWDRLGLQLPWVGRRKRDHAVRAALARVETLHLADQPISNLSGGEIKRVLLAYCLVYPRRLMILDEAPAGLDLRSESEFYQLLNQLKQEQGWAILQISHDLEMVRRHCDRVLCLNRSVLCQGIPESTLSPDNLAAAYGTEFVRYRHTH
jgi:zinc transport system ATP-binding protein